MTKIMNNMGNKGGFWGDGIHGLHLTGLLRWGYHDDYAWEGGGKTMHGVARGWLDAFSAVGWVCTYCC